RRVATPEHTRAPGTRRSMAPAVVPRQSWLRSRGPSASLLPSLQPNDVRGSAHIRSGSWAKRNGHKKRDAPVGYSKECSPESSVQILQEYQGRRTLILPTALPQKNSYWSATSPCVRAP